MHGGTTDGASPRGGGGSVEDAAFHGVRRLAYRFRHARPDADEATLTRFVDRCVRDWARRHPARWPPLDERERIPRRVVEWLRANFKPRPRRIWVGEAKSGLRDLVLARAAELAGPRGKGEFSLRDVANLVGCSKSTVHNILRDEERHKALVAAAEALDGNARCLYETLRRSYDPERPHRLLADDLAERVWGRATGTASGRSMRRSRLDALLQDCNAVSPFMEAVRHGADVVVRHRERPLGTRPEGLPLRPLPVETALMAHLKNGPLFRSPEALDLYAIATVASYRNRDLDAYARIIDMMGGLSADPKRVLAMVRRIVSGVGGAVDDVNASVAAALIKIVRQQELSDLERQEIPKFADLLFEATAISWFNPCASIRLGKNEWWRAYVARKGKAAQRRLRFLVYLLDLPDGFTIFDDLRTREIAREWAFRPSLSDRENMHPDVIVDVQGGDGPQNIAAYEAWITSAEERERAAAEKKSAEDARHKEKLARLMAESREIRAKVVRKARIDAYLSRRKARVAALVG